MERFITELRALQGNRSITRFAIDMGIPPTTLTRIYNGSRGMGVAVLLQILRVYPQLANTLIPEQQQAQQQTNR